MIELVLYLLLPLTAISPFVLLVFKGSLSVENIQKYVLGYHLFCLLILLITFLNTDQKQIIYGFDNIDNLFLRKSLELRINKIIINFMTILHVAGLIQISLREEFKNNIRETFCYFIFYFLVMLEMCSSNILTIVSIEEILLLILYLNYRVRDSLVAYDSRYFKVSNLFMLLGGLVYLIDIESNIMQYDFFTAKSLASAFIVCGAIIKLHLFPFNRNKFSNYTLEMNKGIIEQQFLALLPTLAILTKLISDHALTPFSIMILFYFSLVTVFLTSLSLIVQNNVKNISRLLMHAGICIFILHLCTGNISEAIYSFMTHTLSYLGIVAFIGIVSYKNQTKNLKELKNVKVNHPIGNICLYILIGSGMALPFTPLAFSRYNVILSAAFFENTTVIVSFLINVSLLILSFSIFRFFWYSSHFFKPESKELSPTIIQITTLGILSVLIFIFFIIGIPDLFIENYSFSFRELLSIQPIKIDTISNQRKNITLMYTFAHPFLAIIVIYFLYMKKNKEGKVNDFKFKNATLFKIAEKNFSITKYLNIALDIVSKSMNIIKTIIIENTIKKLINIIGGSIYQGSGFLSTIRPKGINSNLLYAATTLAIMLMFLFSTFI
jgi:formate hydrogenlyase subunit 3/multisubunit Na+/H+ antiporter MnhD subunit